MSRLSLYGQHVCVFHVRTKFKPFKVCQDAIPLPAPSCRSDFAPSHPGACVGYLLGGMVPGTALVYRYTVSDTMIPDHNTEYLFLLSYLLPWLAGWPAINPCPLPL